ncbi:MAG: prolipoprotein diacylglyceryl transferase [Candidatus Woesearchaeota archaeon]
MTVAYTAYGNYWIIKPYLYISPYFVMAAIATIAAIAITYFEFRRRGLPRKHLVWLSILIYLFMGGFARLFYSLGPWSWGEYSSLSERFIDMFTLEPGMVFYGGLIGGLIAILIYARIRKLNFWRYADAWAPAGGLVLFFARIGCFFSGCCYGIVSRINLPWLLQTEAGPIHPTQLYSSIAGMLVFITATELRYRQSAWKLFDGYVMLWTLAAYAVLRFLIEFMRYYDFRFLWLTTSQYISIALLVFCAVLLAVKYRRDSTSRRA